MVALTFLTAIHAVIMELAEFKTNVSHDQSNVVFGTTFSLFRVSFKFNKPIIAQIDSLL